MDVCTNVDDLTWAPHPVAEGVEIKPLVTKKDHDLNPPEADKGFIPRLLRR